MKQMLAENCEQGEGPMIDIPVINDSHVEIEENQETYINTTKNKKRRTRREQNCVVRDFMTALALCHNVTPTHPDENDLSIVEF
jgi:magnesium-transporting ATPase (P-type)